MINERLYGFWKYDQYPFVLGGEITGFREGGRINVKGYDGFNFKPVKILPYEEGVALKKKLDLLEAHYRAEKDALFEVYNNRAKEVIPDAF